VAGILAPVAHWIASFQAIEALKILAGKREAVDRRLWKGDLWKKELKPVTVTDATCSGCLKKDFPYLNRERVSRAVTLCGRNAVQLFQAGKVPVNFQKLAEKLSGLGVVNYNDYFLKASIASYEITLFSNGRAIIHGTEDAGQAKSVYAKYIGG
jgi:adenylyltransferase/sulfurtransferase